MKYDYPEHYAKDALSAIALAEELQASGEYDLFRGQRHTFDIQPSISRVDVDGDLAYKELNTFANWVHQTPDLNSLHGNQAAILAVAQHYGLKTPFLDFSYSPRIAGFFATDGGIVGDTGTIICLNKKRFEDSWKDINERYFRENKIQLTEIVDIDVKNLWRLQAQKGVFLRCHVDPSLLEMFSFFLHIYFPQQTGLNVLAKEKVYPNAKSHLEVLLDQYFLINTYEARNRMMQTLFQHTITVPESAIKQEMESYFIENKLPEIHSSWQSEYAKRWFQEPDEKYTETGQDQKITLVVPSLGNPEELESYLLNEISTFLERGKLPERISIDWHVVSENGDVLLVDQEGITIEKNEFTEFSVSEMVNRIYSGMRYLPYTNIQIARSIARYINMISFGVYDVMDDPQGIELEGARIRGRGFCSRRKIRNALREDFFSFIKPEKLDSSNNLSFRDIIFLASNIKTSYKFEEFIELFVDDVIPSQAAVAVEGLIIGVNPMRIEIFGES